MKKLLLFCVLLSIVISAQHENYPKREVRGAWIATVANIDWPSSRSLSSGEQIRELVNMLDSLKAAGINTIFFQVRTECDALYNSPYEPWSYWLTGEQGKTPDPYYDPLEFAIAETKAREMEIHAWLNPYRAVKNTDNYTAADTHVSVLHPDWLLTFKNMQILDPGHPAVRDFVLKVVADIVNRYDIDGIHFDDYFYPYEKIKNQDSLTFAAFNRGISDVDSWRRDNINILMKDIYNMITTVKPYVKFGISPFGIVKNEYAGTDGLNSYDVLYCDPETWVNDKFVDYVNPQLYWQIGHEKADFEKLLLWWSEMKKDRQMFTGFFSSKFAAPSYDGSLSETGDQLRMTRKFKAEGQVYFSAKSISQNMSGLADSMKADWYKYPAIPPAMTWKDSIPPVAPVNPVITEEDDVKVLTWDTPALAVDGETPARYVIYYYEGEKDFNNPAQILTFTNGNRYIIPEEYKNYKFAVSSLDRLHNESDIITAE